MMKALERLVSTDKNEMKVGNHAMFHSMAHVLGNGEEVEVVRYFTYHGNIIARVNDTKREAFLTNAGWNTSSTNRALNDYKRYFTAAGYEVHDSREE